MTVPNRFTQFPSSLAKQSRAVRFGEIPVLLAHPDWEKPAPTVLWLHGRTANKELDPGRYIRWLRAGIAACAIDLPGHGERSDAALQQSVNAPRVIAQAVPEIDRIVEHLAAPEFKGVFDLDRLAIGGMSLGGMITLTRLCAEHPFRAAAVEATTGDLAAYPGTGLNPIQSLGHWRPIPVLALHSEADRTLPVASMRGFVAALASHYTQVGADPGLVRFVTWPETGAPDEHIGFGRVSNDAKNLQSEFLSLNLR